MKKLYFDYNATTPVLPAVFEAMAPFFVNSFGNPGSMHLFGLKAKQAADQARKTAGLAVGLGDSALVFTSCATEANNMVLKSVLANGAPPSDAHVLVSAVEHPSILGPASYLASKGCQVQILPVDSKGLVDPDDVKRAVTKKTKLVSVMLANNETGVIQPVREIASMAREKGVPVHSDGSQAAGKIKIDFNALGVDYLTLAGHKVYAPKGVGALCVRNGAPMGPLLHGGGQEQGLRSGTENVPYMVAMARALTLAGQDIVEEEERQRVLGEVFLSGLQTMGFDFIINGQGAPTLPNTMNVSFRGLAAGDILSGLIARDVAASGGAACHGAETSISPVLKAMRVPKEYAPGTIRFSWGRPTTYSDMLELLERLEETLRELVG